MPQAKPCLLFKAHCKDYPLGSSPNYWLTALLPFRALPEWVIHTEDLPLIISQGFLKLSVCSDPLLLTEVTFQEPDQWQNTSLDLTAIVKTVDCSLLSKNCWSWDNSLSLLVLFLFLLPLSLLHWFLFFHSYKPQPDTCLYLLSLA